MNRYILTTLIAVGFLFSSAAQADFDLQTYTDLKQHDDTKDRVNSYMTGVGRGIFWANTAIGANGGQELFCMPPKLALDEGLIQSLLDQEIRSPVSGKPYADDTLVEFIMLRAFESRFPCNDTAA
jgi:hypothetical protein